KTIQDCNHIFIDAERFYEVGEMLYGRELEILPKQRLIRLNEKLSRNQVYAEDEDFAFVADYIKARCRNAKVIKS
ncbi:MAG: hypothetical protein IJV46_07155, partial [Acidaminococcaceae bacterium]|nr:hypothetical protein [Acidaminococcaceae bacterium]